MDISEKLKTARLKANLSQKALGDKLGMSQQMIAQYESGKRKPKIETLRRIADALGVGWEAFMSEDEKALFEDMVHLYLESDADINVIDPPQNGCYHRDIEKILDQTKEQLLSQEGLMFDGKPASQEAIDSILSAMQVGMELAKKKNKEK